MDVRIPEIPAEYDAYRTALRAFIAEHAPHQDHKPRAGLRVPDTGEEVAALRNFMRALHDAGYRHERFVTEPVDQYEQRILLQELSAAPAKWLGNPLVSGALKLFGTPEQQAKYLPPMSRGDHIWAQLFSEPDAGSDLSNLKTRAERVGDEYVVNGQKVWSTWAQWSDYGYLLARTEPLPGPAGVSAFVLDMRAPGVEVRPLREITGTADFSEVFLDDVRIPATDLIGKPGDGWRVATMSLASERGGIGSGTEAEALALELFATAAAHTRAGRPSVQSEDVRQQLGRFAAKARIQGALGYKAATRAAQGTPSVIDAPLGKIWFGELNLAIAEYAMRLEGPRSLLAEGDPDAYGDGVWQDRFLHARSLTIAGGSNEILRNMIAERGLELPREPRGA